MIAMLRRRFFNGNANKELKYLLFRIKLSHPYFKKIKCSFLQFIKKSFIQRQVYYNWLTKTQLLDLVKEYTFPNVILYLDNVIWQHELILNRAFDLLYNFSQIINTLLLWHNNRCRLRPACTSNGFGFQWHIDYDNKIVSLTHEARSIWGLNR